MRQVTSSLSIDELDDLHQLFSQESSPKDFWKLLLDTLEARTEARGVHLFISRQSDGENEKKESKWTKLLQAPAENPAGIPAFESGLSTFLDRADDEGMLLVQSEGSDAIWLGILPFQLGKQASEKACLLLVFPDSSRKEAESAMAKIAFLADRPAVFQLKQSVNRIQREADNLSSVLDVLLLLNREEKFISGVMRVCNELASRSQSQRVSLGWYDNSVIKLAGMSHSEKFEKKMDLVRLLELAMEECLDQEDAISWPAKSGSKILVRDHENYAEAVNAGNLCSIPLRHDESICAVLTFERKGSVFSEQEIFFLQVFADQIGPRLFALKKRDRWFGARLYHETRDKLSELVGVRHTFWKVAGIGMAILLGVLFFGRMTYEVEATFSLESEDVVFQTAPFDGYLKSVHFEVGDEVEEDAILCRFDEKELLLEKAISSAELTGLVRQMEIRRAENALAEMEIFQAQADQVRAELERIEYRLDQSNVAAPIDGVVVEGDLREQVGSRFQTGEELFRVVQLDSLFAEVKVDEKDIDAIELEQSGRLAFKSRPGLSFPFEVVRIEPVAEMGEAGNVFTVRVQLSESPESWWRPGLSGLAKIEAGKRSILWILTHETVDYLRLNFWWW